MFEILTISTYRLKSKNCFAVGLPLILALFLIISIAKYAHASSFNNQLVDAADLGDLSAVIKLLKAGHSPDSKGDFGVTPIMRAAFRGNTDIIQVLAESGAYMNAADIGGETALHLAAKNGHDNAVKALLYYGAYVDIPDKENWTPLMRATLAKKASTVELLLDKGADIAAVNNINESVLVHAAIAGVPKIAKMIASFDQDNKIDRAQENMALMIARRKNYDKIVNIVDGLIEKDQNPIIEDTKIKVTDNKAPYYSEGEIIESIDLIQEEIKQPKIEQLPAPKIDAVEEAEIKLSQLPNNIKDTRAKIQPLENIENITKDVVQDIEKEKNIISNGNDIAKDGRAIKTQINQASKIARDESKKIAQDISRYEPKIIKKPTSTPKIEIKKAEQKLTKNNNVIPIVNNINYDLGGSFYVQLGNFTSILDAQNKWEKIFTPNMDILFNLEPIIVKAKIVGGQDVYRLRAGTLQSKNQANNACRNIRARNLDCLVVEISEEPAEFANRNIITDMPWLDKETQISTKEPENSADIKAEPLSNELPNNIANNNYPALADNYALAPIDTNIALPDYKSSAQMQYDNELQNNIKALEPTSIKDEISAREYTANQEEILPWHKENYLSATQSDTDKTQDKYNNYIPNTQNDFSTDISTIRKEVNELARENFFKNQGITPPKRSKQEYDEFYKEVQEGGSNPPVSEAILVPDDTYFDYNAGNYGGTNSTNSGNWLSINNLPDIAFAKDYAIRMFKSDQSLGNIQTNIQNNLGSVSLKVGPMQAAKADDLCNVVRLGGYNCSVISNGQQNAYIPVNTIKQTPKYWINLGTFVDKAEAEYYWMFLKEDNGDLLGSLQYSLDKSSEFSEFGYGATQLKIGPFEIKARASQICGIMRYRNIACLVK